MILSARLARQEGRMIIVETNRVTNCSEWCVAFQVDISDIDILFCYSSSFPAFGDLLTEFSYTLGHKLRPGAQVGAFGDCFGVPCLRPALLV